MLFEPMTLKEAKEFYDRIKTSCLSASLKQICRDDLEFFTDNFERDYGTPCCKCKYYIEIADAEDDFNTALQSKWYDTREQALDFLKSVDYVGEQFNIDLMYAEWDETADCPKDTELFEHLNKNILERS